MIELVFINHDKTMAVKNTRDLCSRCAGHTHSN